MLNSVFDVAAFSETLGYSYNDVINQMEKSRILPFYERPSLEVYKGVGRSYGWTEDLCKIFDEYVAINGEQELSD